MVFENLGDNKFGGNFPQALRGYVAAFCTVSFAPYCLLM